MSTRNLRQGLLLILLLTAAAVCLAKEVPYLSGRVVDEAKMLSPEARERITELSRELEEKTGNQVAVLTITTLESESIEDFAVRVFEHWKLGQQGKDNGVLLLIAANERSMRIEVGYGLEGTLPDVIASRIIRNTITPQFKNGNYDAGVADGIRALIAVLEGDASREVEKASSDAPQTAGPRVPKRILELCLMFGVLCVFTLPGLLLPGFLGWFLYVFMLPFWAMFPLGMLGTRRGLIVLGIYVVGVALIKILLWRSGWYKRKFDSSTQGAGSLGGFSSGSSRSWRAGSSRSSGRSGGFSGRGGRSGGGGASGRW